MVRVCNPERVFTKEIFRHDWIAGACLLKAVVAASSADFCRQMLLVGGSTQRRVRKTKQIIRHVVDTAATVEVVGGISFVSSANPLGIVLTQASCKQLKPVGAVSLRAVSEDPSLCLRDVQP